MGFSLLEVYENELVKAASAEVEAQEVADEELTEEEVEFLEAVVDAANQALAEEVGEGQYAEEDVVKVASLMIDDMNTENEYNESLEKVAEAHEMGTIMADAFVARLQAYENQ